MAIMESPPKPSRAADHNRPPRPTGAMLSLGRFTLHVLLVRIQRLSKAVNTDDPQVRDVSPVRSITEVYIETLSAKPIGFDLAAFRLWN